MQSDAVTQATTVAWAVATGTPVVGSNNRRVPLDTRRQIRPGMNNVMRDVRRRDPQIAIVRVTRIVRWKPIGMDRSGWDGHHLTSDE
jgi:hypothetical protein